MYDSEEDLWEQDLAPGVFHLDKEERSIAREWGWEDDFSSTRLQKHEIVIPWLYEEALEAVWDGPDEMFDDRLIEMARVYHEGMTKYSFEDKYTPRSKYPALRPTQYQQWLDNHAWLYKQCKRKLEEELLKLPEAKDIIRHQRLIRESRANSTLSTWVETYRKAAEETHGKTPSKYVVSAIQKCVEKEESERLWRAEQNQAVFPKEKDIGGEKEGPKQTSERLEAEPATLQPKEAQSEGSTSSNGKTKRTPPPAAQSPPAGPAGHVAREETAQTARGTSECLILVDRETGGETEEVVISAEEKEAGDQPSESQSAMAESQPRKSCQTRAMESSDVETRDVSLHAVEAGIVDKNTNLKRKSEDDQLTTLSPNPEEQRLEPTASNDLELTQREASAAEEECRETKRQTEAIHDKLRESEKQASEARAKMVIWEERSTQYREDLKEAKTARDKAMEKRRQAFKALERAKLPQGHAEFIDAALRRSILKSARMAYFTSSFEVEQVASKIGMSILEKHFAGRGQDRPAKVAKVGANGDVTQGGQ